MKRLVIAGLCVLAWGCESGPPPQALGELDSREFGKVESPITAQNGAVIFQNDDGIVSISMETTKGTAPEGKSPYGKVVAKLIDNSAKASSVTCKIEEPTQRGIRDLPMEWVVDVYCNYTAHKAQGTDIRLTVMPDLGVEGGVDITAIP